MTVAGERPGPRLARERKTLRIMVGMFCRDRHQFAGALCPECHALLEYAHERLANCPFGGRKPACTRCPVHCYRPAERLLMRGVMRHSGPRMLWTHPVLAVLHTLDGLRRPPKRK